MTDKRDQLIIYDLDNQEAKSVKANGLGNFSLGASVTLTNGYLFMCGGSAKPKQAKLLKMDAKILPLPKMNSPRTLHGICYHLGRVYVFGGRYKNQLTSKAEVFRWSQFK